MGERLVIVPASRLVDLLDLVDRAVVDLADIDASLASALLGAAAELRCDAVLEPA